jgi:hypothetical protein
MKGGLSNPAAWLAKVAASECAAKGYKKDDDWLQRLTQTIEIYFPDLWTDEKLHPKATHPDSSSERPAQSSWEEEQMAKDPNYKIRLGASHIKNQNIIWSLTDWTKSQKVDFIMQEMSNWYDAQDKCKAKLPEASAPAKSVFQDAIKQVDEILLNLNNLLKEVVNDAEPIALHNPMPANTLEETRRDETKIRYTEEREEELSDIF